MITSMTEFIVLSYNSSQQNGRESRLREGQAWLEERRTEVLTNSHNYRIHIFIDLMTHIDTTSPSAFLSGLPGCLSLKKRMQKLGIGTLGILNAPNNSSTQGLFKQMSRDLMAYSDHAHRKTIDTNDVECLLRR